jgi:hypothetical protein
MSVAQGIDLGETLLQVVLAEVALTEVGKSGDRFDGLLLADGNEGDVLDRSPGFSRCSADAAMHRIQSLRSGGGAVNHR